MEKSTPEARRFDMFGGVVKGTAVIGPDWAKLEIMASAFNKGSGTARVGALYVQLEKIPPALAHWQTAFPFSHTPHTPQKYNPPGPMTPQATTPATIPQSAITPGGRGFIHAQQDASSIGKAVCQ